MIDFTKIDWKPEESILYEKGVLIACDEKLEWLLPWWWFHYQSYHQLPVAFVDFGMSNKAIDWCKKKEFIFLFINPLISWSIQN
jgi:hypothetical protein